MDRKSAKLISRGNGTASSGQVEEAWDRHTPLVEKVVEEAMEEEVLRKEMDLLKTEHAKAMGEMRSWPATW